MKLSVTLSADVVDAVRELATKRGTSMTEVIRQAIGTFKYFDDVVRDGGHVLIERGGRMFEVIWR